MFVDRLGRLPPPRRAGVFEVFALLLPTDADPRLELTAARTLEKLLTPPPFTLPAMMWPAWYEVLSVWALAAGV